MHPAARVPACDSMTAVQAPEVFRHEPYTISVDTYSFAMILFQLFEHHPPFAGTDPITACRSAAMENKRPTMQNLLKSDAINKVCLLHFDPLSCSLLVMFTACVLP